MRLHPRLLQLGAAALLALVVAGAAIGISRSGAGSGGSPAAIGGGAEAERLFAGIPQSGIELGSHSAPLTLTEFADLQCPFCRQYALGVLPTLVQRYVRRGKLRMVFRDLAFIGPDSISAGLFAAGAGQQDRLWQTVDLLYRNQGRENSGYVTASFLRAIARAVPGLSVNKAFADANDSAAAAQLAETASQAKRFGIDSTPTFFLTRRGGRPKRLRYRRLTSDAFTGPIDAALRGR